MRCLLSQSARCSTAEGIVNAARICVCLQTIPPRFNHRKMADGRPVHMNKRVTATMRHAGHSKMDTRFQRASFLVSWH